MIWATVSSQSCFWWLYRASPSLATKNIISLISVLHPVLSMCRVVFCVVGRGCLLWPVCSLGKTLLAFALLHFVVQGQTCLLLQVSLNFLLLDSSHLWWKGHLFLLLVLENLIGLHRIIQLSFFSISGWGIDLDYYDTELFTLELNRDHSVILRWHPSTAFQTLLLTERATPFLLRDSHPQW